MLGFIKKHMTWIRLVLSIALIAVLFFTLDRDEILEIGSRASIPMLLAAFAFAFGDRILMAYKWNILLRAKNIRVSTVSVTGIYLTSTFLGIFLPATVGADALRGFAISRRGHSGADVISSIVVERIVGLLALLVFVIIGFFLSVWLIGQEFLDNIWSVVGLVAFVLAFVGGLVVLSMNRKLIHGILSLVTRKKAGDTESRITRKINDIYDSYRDYQDRPGVLVTFLLLSFLENMFPILWTYFLAQAFGIDIPLPFYFVLVPIILVLVRIPISLDGFGVQEGGFVYILSLIGIVSSEAFLLGASSHLLAIISVLPGGVLYAFGGLSLRKEQKAAESKAVRT